MGSAKRSDPPELPQQDAIGDVKARGADRRRSPSSDTLGPRPSRDDDTKRLHRRYALGGDL